MLLEVQKILESYIAQNDVIIAGVSGGPDSTALLHILTRLMKKHHWRVIVAHVDHGIRGGESAADARFVQKLGKEFGVQVYVKKIALRKNEANVEEKGRDARRAFFEALREKHKAAWILTAHHADDQLETMLFNFLRGAGPVGMAGMRMAEKPYLKPFLEVSKKEILHYLKQHKLSYRHDVTNDDTRFTRNFIRREIMPRLTRCNANFSATILRNRNLFTEITDFLQHEAKEFLQTSRGGNYSIAAFRNLPMALKREVIQLLYQRATQEAKRLPFVRVQEIVALIEKGHGKKRKPCGDKYEFWVDKGLFSITPCNLRNFDG